MDSDLAESIAALKAALEQLGLSASFGRGPSNKLQSIAERYQLPRRYQSFLSECDPIKVETVTPAERIQLLGTVDFDAEQLGFALDDQGARRTNTSRSGWRPSWVLIGRSGLLGDPYFLDVSSVDAEGDCPVFTAMSGTETWQPRLCASNFALFVRIVAIGMDVAKGFDLDDFDPDNERVFREALGPRIREVDPAALKAGHWT